MCCQFTARKSNNSISAIHVTYVQRILLTHVFQSYFLCKSLVQRCLSTTLIFQLGLTLSDVTYLRHWILTRNALLRSKYFSVEYYTCSDLSICDLCFPLLRFKNHFWSLICISNTPIVIHCWTKVSQLTSLQGAPTIPALGRHPLLAILHRFFLGYFPYP